MSAAPEIQPKFLASKNDLGVVAVGFSGGQGKSGVDAAPTALLASGLLDSLHTELGYTVHHDGRVHSYKEFLVDPSEDPVFRGMKKPKTVSAVTQALAGQVYEHAKEGRLVLTLGGDHSIAIGTIAGVQKAVRERTGREVGVVWVDAHTDINTPETSDSGNIHGMPVAFLTGLAKEPRPDIFGWLTSQHTLPTSKLVYIGLRSVDPGEKALLRKHNIRAYSMHDIDRHGIGHIMSEALKYLGEDTPIHLSFDVDAIDPSYVVGTGTPVRGGLTLREGDFIAECVAETGQCVAVDLVEINPHIEEVETVRVGCSIVRCALGETLL